MLRPGLLYFAYGCNMDPGFLSEQVGLSLARGWPARVDGWRLAFNKGGEEEDGHLVVANMVPDEGCHTLGVVYRLSQEALTRLDTFEDVPLHYRRANLWVEPLSHQARQAAVAYVAQPKWVVEQGQPDKTYLNLLLRGARMHGLPLEYLNWVHATAFGTAREPWAVE
ncbi:MAG: gamma-glutamylcyclotransferase [Gemmatimonadetes bacterium]|nr:gamma-glutamylcyclotransferase [Gemmatimonadota bacterium]NIO33010.1 gamma-glutamylcyclotransferase [Gemmatimonadota bacterium]